MLDVLDISKIGIGAWGLGGFVEPNPEVDLNKQINAVAYSLQKGMNLLEVNYWNSKGISVEIIKNAINKSGKQREKLFLVQALYHYYNPTLKYVEKELEKFLSEFKTDYIDSIQFLLPAFSQYGFEDLCKFIEKNLNQGKTRFVSLTNFNLEKMIELKKIFGDKVFSHELCFNFEVRENEKLGTIEFANKNGIRNVIYQPLRRNRTAQRNWPLLVELSQKYGKTQNQIILNWILSKGFIPLVKSENTNHIDENLDSLNFKIDPEDISKIDKFQISNYKTPQIDWYGTGEGINISQIPNNFDTNYPNNI